MKGQTTTVDPEIMDEGAIETLPAATAYQLEKASVDIQVATAQRYKRSITRFKQEVKDLVSMDESTALSCTYAVPRGGKSIVGPSVRFAEIVASCWGHMRIGGRVVEETQTHVVVQGVAHDLQRNVLTQVEVRRKVEVGGGFDRLEPSKQASRRADAASLACASGIAIATRNATLKTVPKAFWDDLWQEARTVAAGKGRTLTELRATAKQHCGTLGLTDARVLYALESAGWDDVSGDKLAALRALLKDVKAGDRTVDEAFPEPLLDTPKAEAPPKDTKPAEPPVGKADKDGKVKP